MLQPIPVALPAPALAEPTTLSPAPPALQLIASAPPSAPIQLVALMPTPTLSAATTWELVSF